jgi:hypothetical protein
VPLLLVLVLLLLLLSMGGLRCVLHFCLALWRHLWAPRAPCHVLALLQHAWLMPC